LAWTSEEQATTRGHGGLKGKKEQEDNIEVQHVLWSCSDERLRTPSFSITLRMAAFRSCLTVASCTTIPARITCDPAAKVIKSSPDKEKALN
jgi:hypothetical protein